MTAASKTIRSALAEHRRRRATKQALTVLSDRSLEDIGMNRADVDVRFG